MSKLEKMFIPYQQSLDMKELGFNEDCLGLHSINLMTENEDWELKIGGIWTNQELEGSIKAPLYQQAFDFFREKHDLHSYIDEWRLTTGELVNDYAIISDDIDEEDDGRNWKTVKEAQLACLVDLINIIKTKKL
jgi:hypothetical protein